MEFPVSHLQTESGAESYEHVRLVGLALFVILPLSTVMFTTSPVRFIKRLKGLRLTWTLCFETGSMWIRETINMKESLRFYFCVCLMPSLVKTDRMLASPLSSPIQCGYTRIIQSLLALQNSYSSYFTVSIHVNAPDLNPILWHHHLSTGLDHTGDTRKEEEDKISPASQRDTLNYNRVIHASHSDITPWLCFTRPRIDHHLKDTITIPFFTLSKCDVYR